MAFDVKTGAKIWETTNEVVPRVARQRSPRHADHRRGRMYAKVADGTLASPDAATGKIVGRKTP
jgi:hypothetical protein